MLFADVLLAYYHKIEFDFEVAEYLVVVIVE